MCAQVVALIGQRETIAATTRPRMPLPDPIAFACLDLVRHQRVEMGFLGFLEADPIRDGPRQIRIDLREMRPAPDDFQQRRDELVIGALERRDKSYGGSTAGTESIAQLPNGCLARARCVVLQPRSPSATIARPLQQYAVPDPGQRLDRESRNGSRARARIARRPRSRREHRRL